MPIEHTLVDALGAASAADDLAPIAAAQVSECAAGPSFAGFRLTTIALVTAMLALLIWNIWMTRELLGLRHHRLVSVSLASLITDFVRDEAHTQGAPDEAARATKLYLVATQKALIDLGKDGTPVIASEAVLGNSVPDETAAVKVSVARSLAASSGRH